MAGDTIIERWKLDENPMGISPGETPDEMTLAAIVPKNMNGDIPEDVRDAERKIVLKWIKSKSEKGDKQTGYILAYMNYIRAGNIPRPDFVPEVDLKGFLSK